MSSGPVEEFFSELRGSLDAGSFVKLTLSKHRGGDPTLKNIYVKQVVIKDSPQLSFTYRHQTRDIVKNLSAEDGLSAIVKLLGQEFLSGHLFTTERDVRIEFNRKLEARLTRAAPTFKSIPAAEHDRRKRRFVEPAGNVYLRALGVTDERGEVRATMGDKFRQINKFVETLAHLFTSSPVAAKKDVSVVDMGSGKGYLTFATYDYLRNTLGLYPTVVGVEARADLVELSNRVAREAGFDGLEFREGFIRDYELPATDILIALHACDTATDEAIYKGIKAGASLIITAPCCHKELRPQLQPPEVLGGMLKHGILLERQAEMLTDTLRALLLEANGYKTRVFEFITTEHTRKNTMIAAVRQETMKDREALMKQIKELKKFYGVREQRLDRMLRRSDISSVDEKTYDY